jgi:hypothetical protein
MSDLSSLGPGSSPGLWHRFVLRLSQWYAFLVLGRDMGPGLGAVSMDLTDEILRGSVPDEEPPTEMLDQARNTVYDSRPSEILGRANRWSAALESRVISGDLRVPARTVLTTYGLVSFRAGIRLSVIHYLEPRAIFGLRRRPVPARIAGDVFPVIIRPATFIPNPGSRPHWHAGSRATRSRIRDSLSLRGNIWLRIHHKKSAKLGYLTARHAIKEAKLGDVVKPQTYRFPPAGFMIHRSDVMDCAVVRTDFDPGLDFKKVYPSAVVGYKPVRLITGKDKIDAQVVEHVGHVQGVIWAGEGKKEPRASAVVFLNRHLRAGDSGCLVLDCEFEQHGMRAVPYAMYQGVWPTYTSGLGCCQLLEQARRQWNLEFCEPLEDEDERKPRIG